MGEQLGERVSEPVFRRAVAADADVAVPLLYRSGPAAFDHVFATTGSTAQQFLRRAFVDGRGLFGCHQHWVGERDGQVVVAGTAFSGRANLSNNVAVVRQMLVHYRARSLPVMWRGLQLERLIAPPPADVWYLAHLGVAPGLTGQGIGSAFIAHLLERGRRAGFARAGLDVAASNPQARRLYERMGFQPAHLRISALPGLPDHQFMTRPL